MNFQRYLSAKCTVDDRALNPRVADRLADEIGDRDRLRVLEVGAGVGATAVRLLARSWLPDRVTYTALDRRPENLAAACARIPERAASLGYSVREIGDRLVLTRGARRVVLDFEVVDAFEFLGRADREWDLVIAQAFADLVDPLAALAAFRGGLASGGVAYLPITFDGGTAFEPVSDRAFEDRLLRRFHRHIDESGDSRAGRRLLSVAPADGAVLAAGGADWIVRPGDGDYPADEAFFLRYIVDAVAGAVEKDGEVDARRLSAWRSRREAEIEERELIYVAHNLDLLVR